MILIDKWKEFGYLDAEYFKFWTAELVSRNWLQTKKGVKEKQTMKCSRLSGISSIAIFVIVLRYKPKYLFSWSLAFSSKIKIYHQIWQRNVWMKYLLLHFTSCAWDILPPKFCIIYFPSSRIITVFSVWLSCPWIAYLLGHKILLSEAVKGYLSLL